MEIKKSGTPGNWLMQILATSASGNPTNTVLASTTIADAAVPAGSSRLVGVFASPANVAAGQQYALALTRPGSDALYVGVRTDNPCPGDQFLRYAGSSWFAGYPGYDNMFAVYVQPPNVKPPNAFTLGQAALNKKKGTATLTVNLPYPGDLTASGNGVNAASAGRAVISKSVGAGPVQLLIKAKGKKKRKLNATGKVKLNVAITYTPTGGDPSTQSVKVKLIKR